MPPAALASSATCRLAASVALAFCLAPAAQAQDIGVAVVNCAVLNLPVLIDFEEFPHRGKGTRIDTLLVYPGAKFGKLFAGQELTYDGFFDRLSGTPSAPLQLLPGDPGFNLSVEPGDQRENILFGIGPTGYDLKSGAGEGAVSIAFDTDQAVLGLTVEFERDRRDTPNPGRAEIQFFGRDGRLLGAVSLGGERRVRACFQRLGGLRDIAGISITNDDIEGIGIDDIAFEGVLHLSTTTRKQPQIPG